MPVEIREFIIALEVSDQKPVITPASSTTSTSEIIAACVKQVMEILNSKEQR
jgi:hypothetical protein